MGLRPGGRVAEARLAFADWFVAVQDRDAAAMTAMLADEVFVARRQQRRRREELAADLPRFFQRFALEARRPDEIVDLAGVQVADASQGAERVPEVVLAPGDLVVSGRVRFQPTRSALREDARMIVLRPTGQRLLVVALDRWPPLP